VSRSCCELAEVRCDLPARERPAQIELALKLNSSGMSRNELVVDETPTVASIASRSVSVEGRNGASLPATTCWSPRLARRPSSLRLVVLRMRSSQPFSVGSSSTRSRWLRRPRWFNLEHLARSGATLGAGFYPLHRAVTLILASRVDPCAGGS